MSYGAPIVDSNPLARPGALGNIYLYGPQTPYGPYSGLQHAPGSPGASTSTTTGHRGPTNTAESWLNDVLAGKNLPFSPENRGAMTTQATGMNAAAEAARNKNALSFAAAGGASANDPSVRAAQMNNMARRQTDNQGAATQIASQANQANFGAQMSAAGQLQAADMQRQQMQQAASNNAMSFMPWNRGNDPGWQPTQSQLPNMGYSGNPMASYQIPQRPVITGGKPRPQRPQPGQSPPIIGPSQNTGFTPIAGGTNAVDDMRNAFTNGWWE